MKTEDPHPPAASAPEQEPSAPRPGRRDFFLKLGIGCGLTALGAQAAASLRSLVPNVSYDAPTTVKLGMPNDFPDGMKFLPDQRLFVFREGKTFHAVSAVCTHLGCTVRAEALPAPQTKTVLGTELRMTHRFLCPCHSATFTSDGWATSGPPAAAGQSLARYRLKVEGGLLFIEVPVDGPV